MNYLKTGDREAILKKKRVVVKVGTSSITYENGKVNFRYLDHLTRQLADLKTAALMWYSSLRGRSAWDCPCLDFIRSRFPALQTGSGGRGAGCAHE